MLTHTCMCIYNNNNHEKRGHNTERNCAGLHEMAWRMECEGKEKYR